MARILNGLKGLARNRWVRWLALPASVLAVIGVVVSATPPPNIPLVSLAAEPLYARGARAKPTLTLALSVEFPTVGAQYVSTPGSNTDGTYSSATQYIGYFDSESCYVYNDAPTEGTPAADYKRFDRSKAATSHTCGGDSFSGNFMNWASSSAIDILRFGLTGGDRVVDTSTLTVLQRAVLPNTNVSGNFWNGSNFPDKQLSPADVSGAVPTALLGTTPYTGTIHVANCLNRIHFGTTATGNCANPGNNSNLGVSSGGTSVGPVSNFNGALPADFSTTACAGENGFCAFAGVLEVAYGDKLHNKWIFVPAKNGIACSNYMTGPLRDPDSGTVKSCYTRPYTGTWVPGGTTGLTSDTFFYTRVSVCNSSGGTLADPRPDLCLRYPSGSYKPTGNLQKYSDRLRVAAFGYLNDSSGNPNQRYGGVLRAPMKYVGPTAYDANFTLISGANPNQEWDTLTGVFIQNPDANSSIKSGPGNAGPYLSGVTNYLNQFGRTGIFGQYKTYDPVGELYYESVRYLQGLPITSQAVSGITTSMKDGYPVTTTWVDPHPKVESMTDYSCVRNNVVAIGDVNTHNDWSIPGNSSHVTNDFARTANASRNEPDFSAWTKVLGGFESNTGVSYLDGHGVTRTTSNFNPPNSARWGMETQNIGADHASYFMAGVAYWANTHDIRGAQWTTGWTGVDPRRPGMRITTYVLDVNEYGQQSVDSARHNNQFFLTSKYGGFNDVTGTGTPFKAVDLTDSNTSWQDPAHPGEAKNYYLSSSASGVLAALNQIFANIASQADSIAGGAISTQKLTSVAGFIYQAQFDPAAWSGDLAAYSATADTNGVVTIGTVPTWKAAVDLNAKAAATTPGGGGRNIVIGKAVATSAATATNFTWASIDADVKTALMLKPYGTTTDSDAIGETRLNYVRGDRANEAPSGSLMRKRASVLGDVVNSAVAFSGAPSQQISDPSYAAFYAAKLNRKHALFVGANDGMLHAFDPDRGIVPSNPGGDELFAYIPSWMASKLGALTSPSYVHQSYVDAGPAVVEAKVGAGWKTVLVGGTGGGGQGVYALDVSDPNAFSASSVMWEFKDSDDADLGNVIGKPQILKLRTNASSESVAVYKYFAVVASGVNNYANDGHYSLTGSSAIFLLDLAKAAGDAWTLNSNYFKISFQAPLSTIASGMVGFTARLGAADSVIALYVGELQGNLWKLDFTQATAGTSDWNLGKLSYFRDGSNPLPMYIAKDATGNRQPIMMEPALVYGANRSIIVSFGTGKFLELSDNVTTGAPQQSVYAILDDNSTTLDKTSGAASAIAGRARLMPGVVSAGVVAVAPFVWGRALADFSGTPPTNSVTSGWYFDFGTPGERQISNFAVQLGQLVFGSVIPAVNSCDNGNGNLYVVNVATGDATSQESTVGILGEPFVTQVGSSTTTGTDTTGLRTETARYQVILQGSGGLAAPPPLSQVWTSFWGRLSWREISNYQQLRHN